MLLLTHPSCLTHDPGAGHPESPARLRAVLEALDTDRFAALERIEAPRATREQLARVHATAQIDHVYACAPPAGRAQIDADTAMSEGSLDAALRAAGAVVAAVDAVLDGRCLRAFCAVRPPGHHATRGEAMGFCLFNNVAVGAAQALERGIERVAVVDFDVHHGNGTQDIFWNDPRVMYASTHQWPLYPGTGARSETGANNIVNAPLPPGAGLDGIPRRVQRHRAAGAGGFRAAAGVRLGRVSTRTGSTRWPISTWIPTTTPGRPSAWSTWPYATPAGA